MKVEKGRIEGGEGQHLLSHCRERSVVDGRFISTFYPLPISILLRAAPIPRGINRSTIA